MANRLPRWGSCPAMRGMLRSRSDIRWRSGHKSLPAYHFSFFGFSAIFRLGKRNLEVREAQRWNSLDGQNLCQVLLETPAATERRMSNKGIIQDVTFVSCVCVELLTCDSHCLEGFFQEGGESPFNLLRPGQSFSNYAPRRTGAPRRHSRDAARRRKSKGAIYLLHPQPETNWFLQNIQQYAKNSHNEPDFYFIIKIFTNITHSKRII